MKSIFLTLATIALLWSCGSENHEERKKIMVVDQYSDTLFPFVIKLLEQVVWEEPRSAFPHMKFTFHFTYPDIHDSVLIHRPYPFLNVFHDTLDLGIDLKFLLDSIFKTNITNEYKTISKIIDTSVFPQFKFETEDTLGKWLQSFETGAKTMHPLYAFSFSAPILSEDKQFMMIQVVQMSLVTSNETMVIFRNTDSEWKLYKKINRWIKC